MTVEQQATRRGTRRLLGVADPAPASHDPAGHEPDDARANAEALALGRRLRELRKQRELTLEGLASRVGVSRSLISAIELGRSSPSLTTLRKIAGALDAPMAALFTTAEEAGADADGMVVRAAERKRLSAPGSSVHYELLTPDADRQVEFLWAEVGAGSGAPQEETLHVAHTGEENVLVLEGDVVVTVDGTEHELRRGDSISFDCSLPHRLDNRSARVAKLVVAITPPTF